MKSFIKSVFLSLILISCQESEEKVPEKIIGKDSFSMNQPSVSLEELQSEVYQGNVDSYLKLRTAYFDFSSADFLYWAMLMANRHDYGPAYLDVYHSLCDEYIGGDISKFNEIDSSTQRLMLEYLSIAKNKGVEPASEILSEINSVRNTKSIEVGN